MTIYFSQYVADKFLYSILTNNIGVMPFSNVLSIPGINSVAAIEFVGAPASVVMHTPFLRYLTLFPSVPVSASSINEAISSGLSVGLVYVKKIRLKDCRTLHIHRGLYDYGGCAPLMKQ